MGAALNILVICGPTASGKTALALALALSERYLRPVGGAWRVHGGGFAGTIQAFVPLGEVEGYIAAMSEVFGANSCTRLGVRNLGAMELKAEA